MKKSLPDGQNRRSNIHGTPGSYVEYSQTSSGGTIFVNYDAPGHLRWKIVHKSFGTKFFTEHDEILKWTVEQMRERFMGGESEFIK